LRWAIPLSWLVCELPMKFLDALPDPPIMFMPLSRRLEGTRAGCPATPDDWDYYWAWGSCSSLLLVVVDYRIADEIFEVSSPTFFIYCCF
jgi:hypothetical protein